MNIDPQNQRILKVELAGDLFKNGTFPKILLQGKWLAACGFHPCGNVVIYTTNPGELILKYTTLTLSDWKPRRRFGF